MRSTDQQPQPPQPLLQPVVLQPQPQLLLFSQPQLPQLPPPQQKSRIRMRMIHRQLLLLFAQHITKTLSPRNGFLRSQTPRGAWI